MARKFLYVIAGLIVLVMITLIALSLWSKELTRLAFTPRDSFVDQPALPENVYHEPAMWISRPGKGAADPAMWVPEGVVQKAAPQSKAAVFFIHPTSYMGRDYWNAPVDESEARERAELFVRAMASPFNDSAEIWAPRYRQAAFGAFLADRSEGQRALDLAYRDVAQAFDFFLASTPKDAPIVLAGHSQGALLLMRLMKERIARQPLAKRIVTAYPIGWPISLTHDLPLMGLPACATADQANCVISWSSFAEPAEPDLFLPGTVSEQALDGQLRPGSPILCSNPLTGGIGGAAPASANLGTLVPSEDLKSGAITKAAVPARCDENGILLIGDPPQMGPHVLPGNNYHVYDIPLFWVNLRADARRREAAWQKAQ